jgi:mannose-6-phosphate isomerase-like protein (cupin superfamily)
MKIVKAKDLPFIPASHEDPVNPGVWKKVLLKRDDFVDGHVQMVNWAKLPKGSSFNNHHHEDMEEVFIIISGNVVMKVANEEQELEEGDAVVVPPQTDHEMKNNSEKDVEYIVFGIALGDGTGKTVIVK